MDDDIVVLSSDDEDEKRLPGLQEAEKASNRRKQIHSANRETSAETIVITSSSPQIAAKSQSKISEQVNQPFSSVILKLGNQVTTSSARI